MLKKDLENIKPIDEKDLEGYLKDIREKGESNSPYDITLYGLFLVNVKDYSQNDCETKAFTKDDNSIDEPIKFYYKSGDPSCIASRMDCYDNPYKCFMGGYNRMYGCNTVYNQELSRDQVNLVVKAFQEYIKSLKAKNNE